MLIAAALLTPLAATAEQPSAPPPLRVSITASLWIASLDGYIQTPLGGQFGTTSTRRPTISELDQDGITGLGVATASLLFREKHEIIISYTGLERRGSTTLERDLVTHGQSFPSGSRVNSSLEMPLIRIDYRPRWLQGKFRGWTLTPVIGATRLDFHYRLDSPDTTGNANRHYDLYYPHYGAVVAGRLGHHVSTEFELLGSVGLSHVASLDADIRLLVHFIDESDFNASLVFGVRGMWFHYRDDQDDEQNDIRIRVGSFSTNPFAGIHFGLQFSL